MDVKAILRAVASMVGAALVAGAGAAWETIKASLAASGAEWFSTGTINGIILYAVSAVAIFLGGWLVSKLPKGTA